MAVNSAKDRAHAADGTFDEAETCALISARLDALEAATNQIEAALGRLEQLAESGATMDESLDQLEENAQRQRV